LSPSGWWAGWCSRNPGGQAVRPVKLEAGKAILQKGQRLILPQGTVVGKEHLTGKDPLEVTWLRLIPAKKDQWEFEVRTLGRSPLRVSLAPGALDGVKIKFAGFRGELLSDTTLSGAFTWSEQPYEIRDRAGKVLFQSKGKAKD
jgi:hypothetical protein